jgi:hypothetical protein
MITTAIDNEPILNELRLIRSQIDSAISMVEIGLMVEMTEQEKASRKATYGNALVVGDFVITPRH